MFISSGCLYPCTPLYDEVKDKVGIYKGVIDLVEVILLPITDTQARSRCPRLLTQEIKVATVLLFSTFVASCAGTLGGGISEESRDTTGTYDSVWKVEVQKAAGTQNYGKWNVNCGDRRRSIDMRVIDETMTLGSTAGKKRLSYRRVEFLRSYFHYPVMQKPLATPALRLPTKICG